jgi:NhaP-type Na+/H+ or K+/H+ antiporter
MSEAFLVMMTGIIVLGAGAQWLAWRLGLPSILLLLIFGFIAGPLTGFIRPDQMLGDALFPFVSLAVAVILYEGGLSLSLRELRTVGDVVLQLVSVGMVVTWVIGAVAATWVLGLDLQLAVLLGAILVVTGPTVIKPLMRHVRPKGDLGSTLKWEGILIDPIGALMAVLVFEAILEGEFAQTPLLVVQGVLVTVLIGGLVGLAGAGIMILLLRRYWIPDHLQNSMSLLFVVAAYVVADGLRAESGLLAATIMGIALANQPWANVKHIAEFKENLSVVLIAGLFILLAARLDLAQVSRLTWQVGAFIAILIVIGRPLAVMASTLGSKLSWRERAFLASMAPRGIVAAAVASLFALRLVEAGHEGAEQLVPITFATIVATVSLYGLAAKPIARWLGVSEEDPQGLLIMGAHPLAQEIGTTLQEQGVHVLLIDSNRRNVSMARMSGLAAHYGSAVSEQVVEALDLSGIGRFLAMTPNDEANSLATLRFAEVFGRSEVYQLPVAARTEGRQSDISPQYLRGRFLFEDETTFPYLAERFDQGAEIKATRLTERFDGQDFQSLYQGEAIPMFLLPAAGGLEVFTTDTSPSPEPGDVLISMACPVQAHKGREWRRRNEPRHAPSL